MSQLADVPSRALRLFWNDRRKEMLRIRLRDSRKHWAQFRTNRGGMIGFVMLMVFLTMAIFAPFLATYQNPDEPRPAAEIAAYW